MSNTPKEAEDYGAEFWGRLGIVIGGERPFAWATRVGIPKSTFSHCMNNQCLLPLKHLIKVAKFTGVSLKWLITGELGEPEMPVGLLTGEDVLSDLLDYARTLPANKQEMVRDIVKRIAEEECGKGVKRKTKGNG